MDHSAEHHADPFMSGFSFEILKEGKKLDKTDKALIYSVVPAATTAGIAAGISATKPPIAKATRGMAMKSLMKKRVAFREMQGKAQEVGKILAPHRTLYKDIKKEMEPFLQKARMGDPSARRTVAAYRREMAAIARETRPNRKILKSLERKGKMNRRAVNIIRKITPGKSTFSSNMKSLKGNPWFIGSTLAIGTMLANKIIKTLESGKRKGKK